MERHRPWGKAYPVCSSGEVTLVPLRLGVSPCSQGRLELDAIWKRCCFCCAMQFYILTAAESDSQKVIGLWSVTLLLASF